LIWISYLLHVCCTVGNIFLNLWESECNVQHHSRMYYRYVLSVHTRMNTDSLTPVRARVCRKRKHCLLVGCLRFFKRFSCTHPSFPSSLSTSSSHQIVRISRTPLLWSFHAQDKPVHPQTSNNEHQSHQRRQISFFLDNNRNADRILCH
jgi:hypothetical protein